MDPSRMIELSRQIAEGCKNDAAEIDRTPFDKRGVGETFGTILANQMALAKVTESLAIWIRDLRDGKADWT